MRCPSSAAEAPSSRSPVDKANSSRSSCRALKRRHAARKASLVCSDTVVLDSIEVPVVLQFGPEFVDVEPVVVGVVDMWLALGDPMLVHEPTHFLIRLVGEFDAEVRIDLLHRGNRVTHYQLHRKIDELRWLVGELATQFDVARQHLANAPSYVAAVVVPVDIVLNHSEDDAGQAAAGDDDFAGFAVGGDESGVGKDREDLIDVAHVWWCLEEPTLPRA